METYQEERDFSVVGTPKLPEKDEAGDLNEDIKHGDSDNGKGAAEFNVCVMSESDLC